MSLSNGTSDAESQACSAIPVRAGLGGAVESFEDPLLILRGEADARIRNPERSPLRFLLKGDNDPTAGGGILDPVINEVKQNPPQLFGVSQC
jgi:hypothetical protein